MMLYAIATSSRGRFARPVTDWVEPDGPVSEIWMLTTPLTASGSNDHPLALLWLPATDAASRCPIGLWPASPVAGSTGMLVQASAPPPPPGYQGSEMAGALWLPLT